MSVTYCPGSGKRWRKSILFGIPLCPDCLQSWSTLGVPIEPKVPNGHVPEHNRSMLRSSK
jgi:hypothetical protein